MIENNEETFIYEGFCYERTGVSLDGQGLSCQIKAAVNGFGTNVAIPQEVYDSEGKKYAVTSIFLNFFEDDLAGNIETLHIPVGISAMRWDLWRCKRLREIHVDAGSRNYCDLAGVVYAKDKRSLLVFPPAYPAEEYRVMPSTYKIENMAFKIARNLKRLYIPDSVQYIGLNVFYRCSALEHVYIEGNLKTFEGMTNSKDNPPHAVFHYQGKEWTFEALCQEVKKQNGK